MYKHTAEEFASLFDNDDEAIDYLSSNNLGLDKFIINEKDKLIKPKFRDLARLHYICKSIKTTKIIEYGCGYSTSIFFSYLSQFS